MYVVEPLAKYSNNVHLWIQGFSDTVIDMTGVEMRCKKVTRAVEFRQSTNTKIIGLTIDFDPLPFTQGTITAMSSDRRTLTIDLHDGYPRANNNDFTSDKIEIFGKDTDELATTTYYGITTTAESASRFKVVRPSWYDPVSQEQVGDYAVLRNQPAGSIPHAVYAYPKHRLYHGRCYSIWIQHVLLLRVRM